VTVEAFVAGRVLRLHPGRRVATVTVKGVGGRRSYSGAYVAPSEEIAPVVDHWRKRPLGRVVKVDPVAGGGAELSLIVRDNEAWHRLADGSARIDVLVAFESSSSGDPVDGRPVRVEVG
jgi:hypothetical protein